ncbi:MAG TPA: CIA30 family protein [Thermoanaerobaculia bacterium]
MTPLALVLALAIVTSTPLAESRDRLLWVFDDFEDGDRVAAPGESWIPITDGLMGGGSRTRLTVTGTGAAGSRRALRIDGEVAPKGFAGAWSAIAPGGRVGDVSGFAGIRLLARGKGVFSVGLRGGPMPGTNFMAPFALRADWSFVEIPFERLEPAGGSAGVGAFEPANVSWFGVSTNEPGPFSIEIDEIALYRRPGSTAAAPAARSGPTVTARAPYGDRALLAGAAWRQIATDPKGDGKRAGLPDATAIALWRDDAHGRLWVRLQLAGPPPAEGIGFNLALDIDGEENNGSAWWGNNKSFHFDRLVTAFVFDTGVDWQGTFGIADSRQVDAGDLTTGSFERPLVILDRAAGTVTVGFPKAALGTGTAPVRAVAATGSAMVFNDDVPAEGSLRFDR